MRQTERSTICAFLETGEARPPFFMSISIDGLVCMSYGGEWLLELIFDANTFPGNGSYAEKYGIIHVGDTTVAINLNRPPDNIRMSACSFDLKTFETVDVHRRTCAPVTSWKIWHTAEAKHDLNTKPLFVFTILGTQT
jgi:hypothetical protein